MATRWWRVLGRVRSRAVTVPRVSRRSTQAPSICLVAAVGAATAAVALARPEMPARAEAPEFRRVNAVLTRNFIADAVEKAFPAVVNIEMNSGYFASNGSGFIITEDGLVVTNAHVVSRSNRYSKIEITFADGSRRAASIHSIDPLSDIALLQIETEKGRSWPTIQLGSSSELRPGEWVCALGSPFSLANSVSAGIVSAVARHSSELGFVQGGGEYIQTDAAINAGNSGGPLVNLDGEVIGINTMKVDGSVGISFAIPIDTATQVIEQLRENKKVVRAFIGMQMINFNTRELKEIGRRLFPGITEGVIIKSVTEGSPAQKGGLQAGDMIVAFDGKNVKTTKDILTSVGYKIGRKIEIRVKRRGEKGERTLYVTTEPVPDRIF